MNYIKWKDIDSREIKGLIICELPPITKPNMRVAETVIDGVDGSIIEELGYESYDKALSIGLTQNANIDRVIEYFMGSGDVVFSNEKDKYYKATIISQVDYVRLARFRTAEVVFRVQPFKFDYLEDERVVAGSKGSLIIENIGNYKAKPIIEIQGTGTVTLTVNDNTLFRYDFPENETAVIIDSQKQDAYYDNALKNRNMMGEFPIFEVGNNSVAWDGTVESIKIKAYSRWL